MNREVTFQEDSVVRKRLTVPIPESRERIISVPGGGKQNSLWPATIQSSLTRLRVRSYSRPGSFASGR